MINNALHALMVQRGYRPAILDLSPGSRSRGAAYYAVRTARTAWGIFRILAAAFSRTRRRYVMHLDGGAGLVYNIVLALALRLTGQAVLFYHHSSRYVLADSAPMRILLTLAGPAPQLFCSGKMAALFFKRYRPHGPALIVNNAAWVNPVPETGGHGDGGRLRLGFLSALSLEKGLGRAIETLRTLRRRGVPAQLAVAGEASGPAALQMLDETRIEFGSDLLILGLLQGRERDTFLAGLDYFLFPSLYTHETQSLAVPEALSAGVPVIAYDHRFVGEVVGKGGLLIPPAADYAARAADWIQAGEGALQERQRCARQQFEASRAEAAGQMDRLIAWCLGE
ncbi:MAG TPA: glycosyltransferase, partial [Rhizomicrobium sp.]|nr:glycosyltransferase [Rhizomicrobium sp.]